MSLLKIYTAPHPYLTKVAQPVEEVTGEICQMMDDMVETMYAHEGIGLAANQVGILKRIVVMDISEERGISTGLLKMVNPEIIWRSDETIKQTEGCLSLPGVKAEVLRSSAIKVRFLDETNTVQEREANQLFSICLQHEIDHLNGILYVDHLSRLKRDLILNRLKKGKK